MANSVIHHLESEGVVVPLQAVKGVFTVVCKDNIDKNTRSTTSRSNFHGDSYSIQQFPIPQNPGEPIECSYMNPEVMGKSTVDPLPASYTTIKEIVLPSNDIYVPTLDCEITPESIQTLEMILDEEYKWLEKTKLCLEKGSVEVGEWVSWAAHHANRIGPPSDIIPVKSMMLPLFRECSSSPMMVYHGMKVIKAVIHYLNPGQTPVMVADQPLYTLGKKVQFTFSEEFSEDKFIVFLGGMHTEKVIEDIVGIWLEGSGWTSAVSNSGIATSGVAESLLTSSHITRTCYFHQVC